MQPDCRCGELNVSDGCLIGYLPSGLVMLLTKLLTRSQRRGTTALNTDYWVFRMAGYGCLGFGERLLGLGLAKDVMAFVEDCSLGLEGDGR